MDENSASDNSGQIEEYFRLRNESKILLMK
jgi:hypothetical protein